MCLKFSNNSKYPPQFLIHSLALYKRVITSRCIYQWVFLFVKVKLSLCLIKHSAMKIYGVVK
jgi:hypothetical protein